MSLRARPLNRSHLRNHRTHISPGVVLGEGPDPSAVVLGAAAGGELEGSRAGSFELTVGHDRLAKKGGEGGGRRPQRKAIQQQHQKGENGGGREQFKRSEEVAEVV